MGAIHALRVKSPYQLLKIEKIEIENKPNEHGYLYLKCLIDDSINFQSTINASTDDKICVYEEIEDKNLSGSESPNINIVNEGKSKIIFNGTVQNIRTSNLNGVYHLEIQALTSSFELDIKEKSRSFQNANMTYEELIGKVLKDYSGHSFTQWVGEGQKIGKPLFQYKETDWSFLKRVASELNSQLFCDIIEPRNMFYFGTPVKASYKLDDMTHYKAFKNLEQFHKVGEINNGHDTDYFYYEIEKREKYDVGDRIRFKNKELYVKEFSACGIDNEMVYKYKLCRKNGIWQTKIYNSLIGGASLEGKVLAVEGEKVKLHLKIDDNQSEDEAAWFPYAPPTGNVMYSMPIVGTEARLYFPSENGENPRITGCVRTNGSSCAKTSDTTKRYFGTEHGSELEMTPGALNIKGGSKEPLNISIDDEIGVTITSPKKLTLAAEDEIIMKTPKSVKLKAESQILVAKENSQSGFSVENEMHFKSNNVIKDGSCRDTYKAFKDEPEAGQKPPDEEEKSGFNWGGLLMAAAAAVAVVAAVATLGIGAAIVGAVAVACIGAICASSAAATAAGIQSAMGALAISSCAAVCGAVLWDNSNSEEIDNDTLEALFSYAIDKEVQDILHDSNYAWANQPAKKDIFDKLVDWITGDSSPKTQFQQVVGAQYIGMSLDIQQFSQEFAYDFMAATRGAASADRINEILESEAESIPITSGIGNVAKNGRSIVNGATPKSIINGEMREKILNGHRKNPNKNELIGGHSPEITNANPNYAVEDVLLNEDGTRKVKFTTQFSDGKLAKVKTSTLFPGGWSEDKIIASIKNIGDTPSIGVRSRDGATLHRGVIDGVQIEVIKIGDTVTSGYPTGGGANGLLAGFE